MSFGPTNVVEMVKGKQVGNTGFPIEIEWTAWQQLTDAQKEGKHWIIKNAPDDGLTASNLPYDNTSSGSSSTNTQGAIDEVYSDLSELRGKVLWENPNPTSAFTAQQITLSSSDYNEYVIYFNQYSHGTLTQLKGYGAYGCFNTSGGGIAQNYARTITYDDATHITISDITKNGTITTSENGLLVPLKVVGVK